MTRSFSGIIPVMITPFLDTGEIDAEGLTRLVDWYIDHGVDALFAVCQSSEMQHLSLAERVTLAELTLKAVRGRVPVIASGHVSDDMEAQLEELKAIAATGMDGMVLVTNRLGLGEASWQGRSRLASGALAGRLAAGALRMPRAVPPFAERRRTGLLRRDRTVWGAQGCVLRSADCDAPGGADRGHAAAHRQRQCGDCGCGDESWRARVLGGVHQFPPGPSTAG